MWFRPNNPAHGQPYAWPCRFYLLCIYVPFGLVFTSRKQRNDNGNGKHAIRTAVERSSSASQSHLPHTHTHTQTHSLPFNCTCHDTQAKCPSSVPGPASLHLLPTRRGKRDRGEVGIRQA
jgi:hypothetical protein